MTPDPSDAWSLSPAARAVLALFDVLPDVYLFVKDRDHRFRYVNEAEWRSQGCRCAAEMIGKRDENFHPPLLARQYVAEDLEVMTTGKPCLGKIWLVSSADERPRWYSCTKLPIRGDDGRVIGVAGFRRPHDHAGTAPGEYARLTPALEHVLTYYGEPISIADLAGRTGLSVSQFQREFRRLFGLSPREYLAEVRLNAARRELERTGKSLGAIALECGYYDQSYFVKRFKAATGLRPLDYRRRYGRANVGTARGRDG